MREGSGQSDSGSSSSNLNDSGSKSEDKVGLHWHFILKFLLSGQQARVGPVMGERGAHIPLLRLQETTSSTI